MSDLKTTWSAALPTSAGLWQFTCKVFGRAHEVVLVELRSGELWGRMDGEWRPLRYWHEGYTEARWRLCRKASRARQQQQLAEIDRENRAFAETEAHDFHDARVHEILLHAEQKARGKHGWEQVTTRTPLSDVLSAEEGESLAEHEERLEGMRRTLGYLFEDGCHPGFLVRRLLVMAKAIRPDLVLHMSMEEIGALMDEERATVSARMKKIYTKKLAAAGMKGTRSACQKTASHAAKLARAAMGNTNRKKAA